jgi:hypothetical protein
MHLLSSANASHAAHMYGTIADCLARLLPVIPCSILGDFIIWLACVKNAGLEMG